MLLLLNSKIIIWSLAQRWREKTDWYLHGKRVTGMCAWRHNENPFHCPFIDVWSLRVNGWMNEHSTKLQSLRHTVHTKWPRRAHATDWFVFSELHAQVKQSVNSGSPCGIKQRAEAFFILIDPSKRLSQFYLCAGTWAPLWTAAVITSLALSVTWILWLRLMAAQMAMTPQMYSNCMHK